MIRVGIVGYGNLGKGVEKAIAQNQDFCLSGIFTRREPSSIMAQPGVTTALVSDILKYKKDIDVLILCGGSATDLPEQSASLLRDFCCIDSFDTHAKIPEYLKTLDAVGKECGTLSVVSVGWDPGLFSVARAYFCAMLPEGVSNTFWGTGVSQGHSDAVRRIKGVKRAVQYTVPLEDAIIRARRGDKTLTVKDKHIRRCYVVADPALHDEIRRQIITMPNYFAEYVTEVHFITEQEFERDHTAMPHGGMVLRSGKSLSGSTSELELSIKLESNPEFTGSVLVAYARALYKLKQEGRTGALTVLDIPPAYLPLDRDKAIAELL